MGADNKNTKPVADGTLMIDVEPYKNENHYRGSYIMGNNPEEIVFLVTVTDNNPDKIAVFLDSRDYELSFPQKDYLTAKIKQQMQEQLAYSYTDLPVNFKTHLIPELKLQALISKDFSSEDDETLLINIKTFVEGVKVNASIEVETPEDQDKLFDFLDANETYKVIQSFMATDTLSKDADLTEQQVEDAMYDAQRFAEHQDKAIKGDLGLAEQGKEMKDKEV